MIYSASITTPADTAEISYQRTILPVDKGLIYRMEIHFPPGPSGLLRAAIVHQGFQILPTTPGEYFRGDNVSYSFEDLYLLEAEPFLLEIRTWNTDDTFEHICLVHVGLVTKEVYKARFLPTLQAKAFRDLFQEIAGQQEKIKQTTKWGGFTALGSGS